ncbi:MAG: hypothetical protein AB7O44_19720 [Hyphomicrobiaceae bacterium]
MTTEQKVIKAKVGQIASQRPCAHVRLGRHPIQHPKARSSTSARTWLPPRGLDATSPVAR